MGQHISDDLSIEYIRNYDEAAKSLTLDKFKTKLNP